MAGGSQARQEPGGDSEGAEPGGTRAVDQRDRARRVQAHRINAMGAREASQAPSGARPRNRSGIDAARGRTTRCPATELDECRGTCASLALGLSDEPRVDPTRGLEPEHGTVRPIIDGDPRRAAVVCHPVRLELDECVGHDAAGEEPVQVRGVEAVDEVVDQDRPPALEPRHEMDDPERSERIARLGDNGRGNIRIGQAGGRRPEPELPGGSDGTRTDQRGISDETTRNSARITQGPSASAMPGASAGSPDWGVARSRCRSVARSPDRGARPAPHARRGARPGVTQGPA